MSKLVGVVRSFVCKECEHRFDKFVKTDSEHNEVECLKCKRPTTQAAQGTRSYWKPFTPYHHNQLGQFFNTRSEERQYAKKNGVVDISGDFGKGGMAERKSPKEVARSRYLEKNKHRRGMS